MFPIKNIRKSVYTFSLLILFVVAMQSCVNYKQQIMFQGLNDTTYKASMKQANPIIQRGDQLSIFVYAVDQFSAQIFNNPMYGGGQQGAGQVLAQSNNQTAGGGIFGYLVDENGEIEYPKLGVIKVLGFTQQQLRDTLQAKLTQYLKEPSVSVRIMNFRVTYISSDKATTVVIQNNKTNVLQFLGMVGGIAWMDKRNGIKIIRQVDSVRTAYTLNLTDASVFHHPAYYLQPNDIIYVEPNRRKFLETNVQLLTYVTTITSTLSILVLFVNSLRK
jgi:polysaccharide biosynthesis/export protein